MARVALVGLIAGGHSGIPRYAAALTSALDRVIPEFPGLTLTLLTTPAGAERVSLAHIALERCGAASAGPARIAAEQVAARACDAGLLHFFDLTGPVLAPRRPFTATLHDLAVFRGFQGSRVLHKRMLARFAVRRARAVVAVSQFARSEALSLLGADPGAIEVVRSGPGLAGSGLAGSSLAGSSLAGAGLAGPGPARPALAGPALTDVDDPGADDKDPPYLLYVGNFLAHKNLPFLIRAYADSGVEARLVIAGSWGDSEADVRAAIAASPAAGRIDLRSGVEDGELGRLYAGARALLLPSLYEGFGFTALEAMARGCPVLASDIPALRETCGDGARLLPATDAPAWSAAIRAITHDRGLAGELRDAGAANVARYSWEATARGVCGVFARVGAGR